MHYRIQALSAAAALVLALLTLTAHAGAHEGRVVLLSMGRAEARTPAPSTQTTGRKRRTTRRRRPSTSTKSGAPATSAATGQPQPTPTPQSTTQRSAPQNTQGPLSGVAYELPIRGPGAGEERAQGLLTSVSCDNAGVTFNLTASGRSLKLRTADLNSVKFMTFTPEVSGEVTCGARNNNVVVIYRPTRGAKFDGNLLVVQFVPKDFVLR